MFSQCLSASTVISEIFYDAVGPDSGLAFIELFGTPGESLDGLRLEGINGIGGTVYTSFDLSGVIPANGIFVIGDDNAGSTQVPNANLIGNIDYQNGPDSVVLRDDNTIFDAVGYGVFGAVNIFAGEGSPALDPASGSSIARFNPALDTNDNSIDFITLAIPTPGSVPGVSAVPIPAAAYLFLSGLLSMMGIGRRSKAGKLFISREPLINS
jgi:hypothetical protein